MLQVLPVYIHRVYTHVSTCVCMYADMYAGGGMRVDEAGAMGDKNSRAESAKQALYRD